MKISNYDYKVKFTWSVEDGEYNYMDTWEIPTEEYNSLSAEDIEQKQKEQYENWLKVMKP